MTQQATQSLVGTQVSLSAKRGAERFSYLLYAATDMTGKSGDQRGVNKLGGIRMGTGSATKRISVARVLPALMTRGIRRKDTRTYTVSMVRSFQKLVRLSSSWL